MAAHHETTPPLPHVQPGWRVKLYELEPEGAWVDKGTGYVNCHVVAALDSPALVVTCESDEDKTLLMSKIQGDDNYEQQGENIIMWREAGDDLLPDTDYALSFQETIGCQQIWESIGEIQAQYSSLSAETPNFASTTTLRSTSFSTDSVAESASGYMAVDDLYSSASSRRNSSPGPHPFLILPVHCVTVDALTLVRDKLTALYPNQKDYAVAQLMEHDFAYIQSLYELFLDLEARQLREGLSRMAEVLRLVFLLNDSGLIEYFFSSDEILSRVLHIFEYDHTLKVRPQYRHFVFQHSTLKEVVPHDNPKINTSLVFLFRLRYIRDIVLHPAVDEPGISTLSSMIAFTSTDICTKMFENVSYMARVLKVIVPSLDISAHYTEVVPASQQDAVVQSLFRSSTVSTTLSEEGDLLSQSLLSTTSDVLITQEDEEVDPSDTAMSTDTTNDELLNETVPSSGAYRTLQSVSFSHGTIGSDEVVGENSADGPPGMLTLSQNSLDEMEESQDEDSNRSVATDVQVPTCATPKQSAQEEFVSVRKESVVSSTPEDACRFLRELFFLSKSMLFEKRSEMYRTFYGALKKPFLEVICKVLSANVTPIAGRSAAEQDVHTPSVNYALCTSLLCEVLAIFIVIQPAAIRQAILEQVVITANPTGSSATSIHASSRPQTLEPTDANTLYQQSLIFLILDLILNSADPATVDQMGDALKQLLDYDKAPILPPAMANNPAIAKQHAAQHAADHKIKDKLLTVVYEHYLIWLFAPYLDSNMPGQQIPDEFYASKGLCLSHRTADKSPFNPSTQSHSALIASRRVIFEILSQCIMQHSYRMKYFLMRNNSVVNKVMQKIFAPAASSLYTSNRWLYIYANKFIRAILSTKDEFYVKHMEKTEMLKPLLLQFKTSVRRDTLFNSCVYELVEYIRAENIKVLILHLVNKHAHCFEDVTLSDVFDRLRIRYDQIMDGKDEPPSSATSTIHGVPVSGGSSTPIDKISNQSGIGTMSRNRMILGQLHSGSGRTSLRDEEEDYFFSTDDDEDEEELNNGPTTPSTGFYVTSSTYGVSSGAKGGGKVEVGGRSVAEDEADEWFSGHNSNADNHQAFNKQLLGSTFRGKHSSGDEDDAESMGSIVLDGHKRLRLTLEALDRSPPSSHGSSAAVPGDKDVAGSILNALSRSFSSPDKKTNGNCSNIHNGNSNRSALFSMLSAYGDDEEQEEGTAAPVGDKSAAKQLPASAAPDLILDIYDEHMMDSSSSSSSSGSSGGASDNNRSYFSNNNQSITNVRSSNSTFHSGGSRKVKREDHFIDEEQDGSEGDSDGSADSQGATCRGLTKHSRHNEDDDSEVVVDSSSNSSRERVTESKKVAAARLLRQLDNIKKQLSGDSEEVPPRLTRVDSGDGNDLFSHLPPLRSKFGSDEDEDLSPVFSSGGNGNGFHSSHSTPASAHHSKLTSVAMNKPHAYSSGHVNGAKHKPLQLKLFSSSASLQKDSGANSASLAAVGAPLDRMRSDSTDSCFSVTAQFAGSSLDATVGGIFVPESQDLQSPAEIDTVSEPLLRAEPSLPANDISHPIATRIAHASPSATVTTEPELFATCSDTCSDVLLSTTTTTTNAATTASTADVNNSSSRDGIDAIAGASLMSENLNLNSQDKTPAPTAMCTVC